MNLSQTLLLRIIGISIVVMFGLLAYILQLRGDISFVDLYTSVFWLILEISVVAVFELVLIPKRFVGASKREKSEEMNETDSDQARKELLKGIQFYRTREELPSLQTFLSQAKQEVFVVGTTLHAIVGSNRELIRNLVKRGVTIRLLFLDPKSKFLGALSDCLIGESEYGKAIDVSLKTTCSVKRELTDLEKNRLDIRTYDTIPFYTMLVVDPNSGNGVVRIEPYFYGKGERARSCFQIFEKEQKEEFQKHLAGYNYLCKISKEYKCS